MSRACATVIALLGLVVGPGGCTRADVFPITRDEGTPDPSAGNGGASGSDHAGAGGSNDGAGTAGASGNGDAGAPAGGVEGSPGCELPPPRPGDSNHTVLVRGVSRSYVLHVPPTYSGSEPVPLVVDFHGAGESGASERASSPYPELLDREGVVMAFPDGLRGPAGPAWNVGPCCVQDADDVAFARALVAQIQQTLCIDPGRIYATGVLTGGGMAHYVACHAADVFAAVAPAAFDLLQENVDDCVPARPIGVVTFRGTADARVPYAGGPSSLVPGMPLTFLGAEGTFERWAAINRCSGPPSPVDDNGCSTYASCEGGVEVVLCSKRGGGAEPGDPSIAWPILARHALSR